MLLAAQRKPRVASGKVHRWITQAELMKFQKSGQFPDDPVRITVQQISANVSSSGIYFYIYCANYCSVFVPRLHVYCSVFVPGRSRVVQKLNNNSHNKRVVLVQKLNNNSHNKCKSTTSSYIHGTETCVSDQTPKVQVYQQQVSLWATS